MKKILFLTMIIMVSFVLVSCGRKASREKTTAGKPETAEPAASEKTENSNSEDNKADKGEVEMNIPKFKYHPDPIGTGAFKQGEDRVCDCCSQKTNIWYESPFYTAQDNIECICPTCISTGAASAKFDGEFQDSANVDDVSDSSKLDELTLRTPGYCGWQQEYWIAHCDDYCAFIGYVGWKELVEMGIDGQIEKNYDSDLSGFDIEDIKESMKNGGSMQGYLFRCLHCGEHFLYVDCD